MDDDTGHYLQAAAAQQAQRHGAHWAHFWLWCISSGRLPLPADDDDLRAWLSTSTLYSDIDEAHAALLEIDALHLAMELRRPFTGTAGEPS